jgi:hypothetical protein
MQKTDQQNSYTKEGREELTSVVVSAAADGLTQDRIAELLTRMHFPNPYAARADSRWFRLHVRKFIDSEGLQKRIRAVKATYRQEQKERSGLIVDALKAANAGTNARGVVAPEDSVQILNQPVCSREHQARLLRMYFDSTELIDRIRQKGDQSMAECLEARVATPLFSEFKRLAQSY